MGWVSEPEMKLNPQTHEKRAWGSGNQVGKEVEGLGWEGFEECPLNR